MHTHDDLIQRLSFLFKLPPNSLHRLFNTLLISLKFHINFKGFMNKKYEYLHMFSYRSLMLI
jgi:hypothetical protein